MILERIIFVSRGITVYTKGMRYKNGPLHQNIHILSYVCDVQCVCMFRPKEMVMILALAKMGHWANWTMHTRHCINAVFEAKGIVLYLPRVYTVALTDLMMVVNWPKHVVLLNLYKTPCNQDSAFVVFDGCIK